MQYKFEVHNTSIETGLPEDNDSQRDFSSGSKKDKKDVIYLDFWIEHKVVTHKNFAKKIPKTKETLIANSKISKRVNTSGIRRAKGKVNEHFLNYKVILIILIALYADIKTKFSRFIH